MALLETNIVHNPRSGMLFERDDLKCSNCQTLAVILLQLDSKHLLCKSCLSNFIKKIDEAILQY